MKTLLTLPAVLMTAALLITGCQTSRAGYETAPYRPVRTASPFELRDYPALTVVETPMNAAEGNAGFGRLFRFISGRNEEGEKIAMTTPVFMGGNAGAATMAFVMPAGLNPSLVPRPTEPGLSVREIPPGRFAVMRFSGGRSEVNEKAALDRLQTWMAAENLRASAPPVFGYFDPPWTPPFLRRNEVMLSLDAPEQ